MASDGQYYFRNIIFFLLYFYLSLHHVRILSRVTFGVNFKSQYQKSPEIFEVEVFYLNEIFATRRPTNHDLRQKGVDSNPSVSAW